MYYPESIIEEVREKNDIIDVITEYIQLDKKGSSFFGLCPFHHEKTPSFSVSSDKQMYYCFGCGAGGNVYTFIMQIENYSFIEAVQHLANRVQLTLPSEELSEEGHKKMYIREQMMEINRISAKYYCHQLYSNRGQKALQYLIARNVKKSVMKRFGLGYSTIFRDDLYQYLKTKGYDPETLVSTGLILGDEKKNNYHDRFWNRVMFPIFNVHGKVIGFGGRVLGNANPKYLNSSDSMVFDKSKNLYGLHIARQHCKEQVIVVEGYMDVIALHQEGIENAVASLGTAFTYEQARLLKRYTKEVILLYDSDEAGTRAAIRAIPILQRQGLKVKILQIPEYKDPDEFIQNKGKEAFEKLLVTAKHPITFQIDLLKKQFDLSNAEHKVTFLMRAAGILVDISNEVEMEIFAKQLCEEMNLSYESLQREILKIKQNQGLLKYSQMENKQNLNNRKDESKIKKTGGFVQAQRNILSLLIQEPMVYSVLWNYISIDDFIQNPVYQKIASYIYDQYEKNQKIEEAKIINLFYSVEEQNQVSELFYIDLKFDSVFQKEKAITDQVKIIKRASIDYYSRTLEDVEALQNLIYHKQQLQNLHISLNYEST